MQKTEADIVRQQLRWQWRQKPEPWQRLPAASSCPVLRSKFSDSGPPFRLSMLAPARYTFTSLRSFVSAGDVLR